MTPPPKKESGGTGAAGCAGGAAWSPRTASLAPELGRVWGRRRPRPRHRVAGTTGRGRRRGAPEPRLSRAVPRRGPDAERNAALNFVTLGPGRVLLAGGVPAIQDWYERIGLECRIVATDELRKAAGGIGCLTGILERDPESGPRC